MYGNLERVTDGEGLITETEFDAFGRPVDVTAPSNNVIHREYDVDGRLTRIVDSNNDYTNYRYDPLGRQRRIIDSKGTTQIDYDIFGNRILLIDHNGNETKWKYNQHDQLEEKADRFNNKTKYEYDAAGRVSCAQGRLWAGEMRELGSGISNYL